MKVNVYIGKNGLAVAEKILSNRPNHNFINFDLQTNEYHMGLVIGGDLINLNILARMVESHKLVNLSGGVGKLDDRLKHTIASQYFLVGDDHYTYARLEQAIEDVQSCEKWDVEQ